MLQTITGLFLFLPKMITSQRVRAVCIVMLSTGTLCFSYNINNIYASPGSQEAEKVLGVDDSEAIPATIKAEEPIVTVSTTKRNFLDMGINSDFNLGVYYQKQGDSQKAIDAYQRVLGLDPDNAEAHNNLGVIYKKQNNFDKAVEHFQHVVTFNPGMDEAHNNLGVVYYLNSDHRNAVMEYRKALELNSQNMTSQINLGLVYRAQGLGRQAIDIIEEVLVVEPFNLEAHYNLAILYEELGHLEKATWHYTRFHDNVGKSYPALAKTVSDRIEKLQIISGEILGSRDTKIITGVKK